MIVVVRVQGPVHSTLDVLTVELLGFDAAGDEVLSEWVELDLGDMVRGTPVDKTLVLDTRGAALEGIAVDLHPVPDAEAIAHLAELEGVPD
jgi:hypothetical protein